MSTFIGIYIPVPICAIDCKNPSRSERKNLWLSSTSLSAYSRSHSSRSRLVPICRHRDWNLMTRRCGDCPPNAPWTLRRFSGLIRRERGQFDNGVDERYGLIWSDRVNSAR
jgi:hypothetical protein